MTLESSVWSRLIGLVIEAETASGDTIISQEISDFRLIRREDAANSEKRKDILARQRTARQIDEELSTIGPERLRLTDQEIAIELVKSIARTVSEIPMMLDYVRIKMREIGKYNEKPNLLWLNDSNFETSQVRDLENVGLNSSEEATRISLEILAILDDAEVNGWQV